MAHKQLTALNAISLTDQAGHYLFANIAASHTKKAPANSRGEFGRKLREGILVGVDVVQLTRRAHVNLEKNITGAIYNLDPAHIIVTLII